jgi:hypothetical protein
MVATVGTFFVALSDDLSLCLPELSALRPEPARNNAFAWNIVGVISALLLNAQ